jgi:hypothetical protein
MLRPAHEDRSMALPVWRRHPRRDPEAEQQRLRRRFVAVSRRLDRAARWRGFRRRAPTLLLLGAVSTFAGWSLLTALPPWPLPVKLRHLAAVTGCAAATTFGLAPARRGEPGYWRRLDADHDGRSCELGWPGRRRGQAP